MQNLNLVVRKRQTNPPREHSTKSLALTFTSVKSQDKGAVPDFTETKEKQQLVATANSKLDPLAIKGIPGTTGKTNGASR